MNTSEVYTSAEPDMDLVCLAHARLHAKLRSKDPNTKVGAVVYDPKTGSLVFGYNGFPKGIPDLKELWDCRDVNNKVPLFKPHSTRVTHMAMATKYDVVNHGEKNAVRKALSQLGDLSGCTLVITHFPCHNCMKDEILPSGIRRVVYGNTYPDDPITHWMAATAGCQLIHKPGEAYA